MDNKTLEICRALLVCENCHNDRGVLLKVRILSKGKYSNKKLCFHCIRKNKLSIEWKGTYWKKIFYLTT